MDIIILLISTAVAMFFLFFVALAGECTEAFNVPLPGDGQAFLTVWMWTIAALSVASLIGLFLVENPCANAL